MTDTIIQFLTFIVTMVIVIAIVDRVTD